MRFLGIDYGTKRIGLAVSDESGRLAFPKGIILNDEKSLKKINVIITEENIAEVVIGESLDFKGEKNALWYKVENFINELKKKVRSPIQKQKEFLTSVEARTIEGKEKNNARKIKKEVNKKIDDSAAALILQRYLDQKNK